MAIPTRKSKPSITNPTPALLQHSHFQHTLQLLQFALLLLHLRFSRLNLRQQKPCNIQNLLQLFRPFQLHMSELVAIILFENLEKLRMPHFDLHLLLWRSIAMTNHCHDAAQLHHFSKRGRHNRRIVQLKWHRPRNVQRWRQLAQYHIAQYLGAIIVVLVGILHKTEPVHVAHKRFAIRSQQIKTAHRLLEGQTHFPRDQLLGIAENHRIANLFALAVALHFAIERRTLARLGVRIVRPNGVHLDVGAVGRHKVLVDERAGFAHPRLGRVDAAAAADLAEQPLAAAAGRCRVVDVDVVIFGGDGLLDERLVENDAVDFDMVFGFDQFVDWCGWS